MGPTSGHWGRPAHRKPGYPRRPTHRSRRNAPDLVARDPLVALAERLQGICLGRSRTVGTAESCTGGLVASAITDVAGSSGYFRGAVVAYADETKQALLGVS